MEKAQAKSTQNEEPSSSAARPIGENEEDFETVLLDGCLGFGLSLGNAALVLVEVVCRTQDVVSCGLMAVCSALAASLLLRCGQLLTDVIQFGRSRRRRAFSEEAGRGECGAVLPNDRRSMRDPSATTGSEAGKGIAGERVLACLHAAAFVLAALFLWMGVSAASLACASCGLVAASFLYGRFLVALARKALMFIVDALFMYVGAMALVLSQVGFPTSGVMVSVSMAVSVMVTLLFGFKPHGGGEFVSAADSKDRSIKVKGNNHTLLLIGFMFGAAFLALLSPYPRETVTAVVGSAVGVAGILSLMLRQLDERTYKESLKKSMAFVSAALLLLLPLASEGLRLVILAVYLCFTSLNVIVLLNAVVETSRFDMISPVWLFGQEGSVFFLGIALGGSLSVAGAALGEAVGAPLALQVICLVAVVVCAWMQIRVNYQIYPFEPVIEMALDEETHAQIEHEGRRKALWHRKTEAACERYRLSPREREVLATLLKGRDAKYIMDKFYISQSTAKTHIYNIYRKFGVHSRQELLDFIEGIELVDEEPDATDETTS